MKSNDAYGMFEVFHPGYMEGSFFHKLGYWFRSVFWYHYKKQTILILCGILLLSWLIYDMASPKMRDLDYVVSGKVTLPFEMLEAVDKRFAEHIEDIDGDGTVTVGHQMLTVSDEAIDEYTIASTQKLGVTFAEDTVVLYLLEYDLAEYYAAQGAFEPLSTFGIKSENKYCVRVDQSSLFKELGIPATEQGWYLGIKVQNEARKSNPMVMKKYDAAAEVIRAVLQGRA